MRGNCSLGCHSWSLLVSTHPASHIKALTAQHVTRRALFSVWWWVVDKRLLERAFVDWLDLSSECILIWIEQLSPITINYHRKHAIPLTVRVPVTALSSKGGDTFWSQDCSWPLTLLLTWIHASLCWVASVVQFIEHGTNRRWNPANLGILVIGWSIMPTIMYQPYNCSVSSLILAEDFFDTS